MNITTKIKKELTKLKNIKILCIGDVILDEYVLGKVNRISPESPVPILDQKNSFFKLGGAANVANNIASLGAKVKLIHLYGNDNSSKEIKKLLKGIRRILSLPIKINNYKTPKKTRFLNNAYQILRLDQESEFRASQSFQKKILSSFKKEIKKNDIFILSDYNKGILSKNTIRNIIEIVHKNKKMIIIDPKKNSFECFAGADIITPNVKEFQMATNLNSITEVELVKNAKKMCNELSIKEILITRSNKGMLLVNKNGFKRITAIEKKVADVTGAGDTVVSILALMKAIGFNSYTSSKIANLAASKIITKIGAETLSMSELFG